MNDQTKIDQDRAERTEKLQGMGCKRKRVELEGYGDVEALSAGLGKFTNGLFQPADGCFNRFIADVLTRLTGERHVDVRRLRMAYRIAEYGISVGHDGRS